MSIRSATNVALYFSIPTPGLSRTAVATPSTCWKVRRSRSGMRFPQGSVFVFYQHETNKAGKPWIEDKRAQLADAIRIPIEKLGVASSPKIAKDVVLFYASKA